MVITDLASKRMWYTKRSLKLITDKCSVAPPLHVATSQSWAAGFAGVRYKRRNLMMRARSVSSFLRLPGLILLMRDIRDLGSS